MIRFVYFFNYTEGISLKDGETWYLTKHVSAVKELPSIINCRSWKQWDAGIPFPSPGAPAPFNQFVRRTELVFIDKQQGIKAIRDNQSLFAPTTESTIGFRECECMFLDEEPEFNFLRDVPYQHYKYITLPLWWPKGRPQVEENDEIFIDSYCFSYSPGITWTDGEDWYLGHHTREGKQLPGIRHYKTWRVIKLPDNDWSILKLNKWDRLTELGMSPRAFKITMVDDDTRIRFTQSPISRSGVIRGWLNISIKLDEYDGFIE